MKMTPAQKILFLESVELPILYNDNRQLQFFKEDGEHVDSFDPVWDIKIKNTTITIIGCAYHVYIIELADFDCVTDIVEGE